jgi:hypothetical protein
MEEIKTVKIVGVCKISGLPAREVWSDVFGGEGVFCMASHKGECDWERASKEDFIKALKKERELEKRLKEENSKKPILEHRFTIPIEWC